MTGTCQNMKRCCDPFIEPQLTSFLVFYNLPRVFKIFTSFDMTISGKFLLDADARNTTPVKMTGSTIL